VYSIVVSEQSFSLLRFRCDQLPQTLFFPPHYQRRARLLLLWSPPPVLQLQVERITILLLSSCQISFECVIYDLGATFPILTIAAADLTFRARNS